MSLSVVKATDILVSTQMDFDSSSKFTGLSFIRFPIKLFPKALTFKSKLNLSYSLYSKRADVRSLAKDIVRVQLV